MEKYCIAGQTADDSTEHAHCMHFLCNNGCTNPPQYYVIRTLPVLFQQFSLRNRYKSAEFLFYRLQFWGLFCSIVLDVAFIEMNIKAKFTLLHFRLSKPSHTLRCLLHVGNTDRIWRKKIWASINFKQLVGVKKSRILVKETVLWGQGKGGCTLLVLRDDAEL